jgi:hypothetical protein
MTLSGGHYTAVLKGSARVYPRRRRRIQQIDEGVEQTGNVIGDGMFASSRMKRLRYSRLEPTLENLIASFCER